MKEIKGSNYGVLLFYNHAVLNAKSKEQIRTILCKAAQARCISKLYFDIIVHFANQTERLLGKNHV